MKLIVTPMPRSSGGARHRGARFEVAFRRGSADVHVGILPGIAFRPAVHLNDAEAVLPMKDGLPKLRDLPAEAGGSGEAMPE